MPRTTTGLNFVGRPTNEDPVSAGRSTTVAAPGWGSDPLLDGIAVTISPATRARAG